MGLAGGLGCATAPSNNGAAGAPNSGAGPKTISDLIRQDQGDATHPASRTGSAQVASTASGAPSSNMKDYGEMTVLGVKLKNTHFDYPAVVNSRVEHWVEYFTGRGRPYFEKYLERSEFFIPYIRPLLKQNGLPEDLVYLAMIESGFNNLARSHARAVGPWQFISATGKRYGLMVNWWVDERRDTRKATLAAVEYLRDLYNIFQSWELAAAAYNAGEAKIARAVQRFSSNDFWVISRHRFLRPETRDYVPKIIAAAIVAKNRELFGFKTAIARPGADEAVAGDGEIVKVIKTDKPLEGTEVTSEAIKAGKVPPDVAKSDPTVGKIEDDQEDELDDDDLATSDGPSITPATLSVPLENTTADGQLVNNSLPSVDQPLAKPVPMPLVSKSGQVSGDELAEFEVQSPADLLKVARASGLSYLTVKSLNPELMRWCTPPTVSTYRIKLPASTKEKFLATYNQVTFPRQVQFLSYKVHRGETLNRIAQHFGIKVDPISDLNGLSSRMPLRNGLRVLLPMPNDRSRSLASLDVRDPPEHRRARRRRRRFKSVSSQMREEARTVAKR